MLGGYQKATNNFEKNSTGELSELFEQPREKYFVFNIIDCNVNYDLLRSGARRRAFA
jgi:hypothetical protein